MIFNVDPNQAALALLKNDRYAKRVDETIIALLLLIAFGFAKLKKCEDWVSNPDCCSVDHFHVILQLTCLFLHSISFFC